MIEIKVIENKAAEIHAIGTAVEAAAAAAASAASASAAEAHAVSVLESIPTDYKTMSARVEQMVGYDNSLTEADFATLTRIEERFETHNGVTSSAGTWVNVNASYKHIVIPVKAGDTFQYKVSSDSSYGCSYIGLTNYVEPTASGQTIANVCDDLPFRSIAVGSSTGLKTIPDGCNYLCLSVYNNSALTVFETFKLKSVYVGTIEHKIGTIYVSATGDDTTGDGSYETPYRSIQKAIDSGEQVVCVKPGAVTEGVYAAYSYAPFRVYDRVNPLTVTMYDPPEYTYVKGATWDTAGTRVEPKIVIDQTSSVTNNWHGISIKNSKAPVTLNDIEVTGASLTYAANSVEIRHAFNFENCSAVDVNRCIAHHNTTASYSGFHYSNASGVLRDCIAHHVKMDGFNFHSSGNTQLINCKAYYNGDDGVSHHDGCTGVVIGGEFDHNGKGGISSPYGGCTVDIMNAYCHHNTQYGVYAASQSAKAASGDEAAVYARPRNILRMNNCVMKNNATKDIYLQQTDAVGIDICYDTSVVHSGWETRDGAAVEVAYKKATLTEIKSSAAADIGTKAEWQTYIGGDD